MENNLEILKKQKIHQVTQKYFEKPEMINMKNKVFYKFYKNDKKTYKNFYDALINFYTFFTEIEEYRKNDKNELFSISFSHSFDADEDDDQSLDDLKNKLFKLKNNLTKDEASFLNSIISLFESDLFNFLITLDEKEQTENLISKLYNNFIDEMVKIMNDFLNHKIKAFCLTERFDNNRMWDQYGENSTGFCVGFKIINKNIFMNKMKYIDKKKIQRKRNQNFIIPKECLAEEFIYQQIPLILDSLFLKDKDYSNEKEYRMIIFEDENKIKYVLEPFELILGENFNFDENILIKRKIIKEFQKRNLPIFKYNALGKKIPYAEV